jgi:GGDEF domain-containing protein
MTARWFHVGDSPAVRDSMAEALQRPPERGAPTDVAVGDVVVVEAFAGLGERAGVAGGNAFSACRAWKLRPGVTVHLVVRDGDPVGVQLARFVLADSVLRLDVAGRLHGLDQLTPHDRQRTASTIDALLARHGKRLADLDESVILGHIRAWEQDESFLQRLQDPETGLFDGAYASLKLDEEWKRAVRFHLPLSLVLLDIGGAAAAMPEGPDRRALLADVASVFLNECRDIDVLGRFTTTTFLFLLPGTPPGGAEALARRLLETLRQRRFAVSLVPAAGVVSAPATGIADRKDFLVLAEACLDRARAGLGVGGLVAAWE